MESKLERNIGQLEKKREPQNKQKTKKKREPSKERESIEFSRDYDKVCTSQNADCPNRFQYKPSQDPKFFKFHNYNQAIENKNCRC